MPIKEQLEEALADRYSVDRQIGEGGMATVYCARDIRHKRNVAIKVLRPDLGAVLGVDRFLSEIQVTANLQHPNLLPLFDSGEANGLLFYVMPFIEGESLRARLDRERQLPVEEAVRLAVAVGSALDYAHRHGVIHRDLKPENILLHEGQPLVADFGIALAVAKAGGGRITQTGLSLGTPHYMSPEQATGDRVIDARSDIYSLGAVTYEMLVGEPPHTGATSQAIIARVLTEKPRSIRSTRPSVPVHVEAAVEHALEKLAPDRFATVREFNEAISGSRPMTWMRTSAVEAPTGIRGKFGYREIAAWTLAAGAIALAIVALTRESTESTAAVPAEFDLQLPDSFNLGGAGAGHTIAVSRDGGTLVLVGNYGKGSSLYVRRIDERTFQEIKGADGARSPSFSPDGEDLVFTSSSQQLKRISLAGGTPRTLATSAAGNGQSSWGDGHQIVYGHQDRLMIISDDGGTPKVLATPDSVRNHAAYGWPTILPGGRAALITIWKGRTVLDSTRIGVVTIPEGKVAELGDFQGTNPRYAEPGDILYGTRDSQLFSVPFSRRSLKLTGSPVLVAEGIIVGPGGPAGFAISSNGTLAYGAGSQDGTRNLVTVSRAGQETPLNLRPGYYQSPRVSPNGQMIAMTVFTGRGNNAAAQLDPHPDIWSFDLKSETLRRVTTDSTSSRPVWSADGLRIAYVNRGDTVVMWRELYASARPAVLAKVRKPLGIYEIALGPQHGHGIIRVDTTGTGDQNDLYVFHPDSGTATRPFMTETYDETTPRISPDGRLVAYVTNKTGVDEVYVRPLRDDGSEILVSRDGGDEPQWSPTGRELFYRGPRSLMAAGVVTSPRLEISRPDSLFADRYAHGSSVINYGVFPDGQRFVMMAGTVTPNRKIPVIVRLNWRAPRRDRSSRR